MKCFLSRKRFSLSNREIQLLKQCSERQVREISLKRNDVKIKIVNIVFIDFALPNFNVDYYSNLLSKITEPIGYIIIS